MFFHPPEHLKGFFLGEHVATLRGNVPGIKAGSDMNVFAGVFEIEDHIVVITHGTKTRNEWFANFNAVLAKASHFPGRVHLGFSNIYTQSLHDINESAVSLIAKLHGKSTYSMQAQLIKILSTTNLNGKTVVIAGHSLGGALSTLMAFDIATFFPSIPLVHVTLGSSRVGTSEFVKAFNKRVPNSFRVINNYDLVPKVPPTCLRYEHIAKVWNVKRFNLSKDGCCLKSVVYEHIKAYVDQFRKELLARRKPKPITIEFIG